MSGRGRLSPGRIGHAVFDHYRKPRVLGLDLLRITAACSIVLHHGNTAGLVGQNVLAAVFGTDGYLAVDVFFVLSGWLLTRQVLRMRAAYPNPIRLASTFWIRRWARTLPPYWVVLLVIFVLGPARLTPGGVLRPFSLSDLVTHAFFLQTVRPPNLFPVSWSLITEEWFYLLLPFTILVAARIRRMRGLVAFVLGALLLPTLIRTVLLLQGSDWDGITRQPIARWEGLVVGASLAAASVALPAWERHVLPRRRQLFLLACPPLAFLLAAGTGTSPWFRVFGLLGFSVCVGLLIPWLSRLQWGPGAPLLAVMAIAYLAELTYPLYLVHTLVPHLSVGHAHGLMRLAAVVASVTGLLLAASALHLGVERPFLHWREQRVGRRPAAVAELPAQVAVQPA